ncbi:mannose-1-phosphate guanylyltransferase [Oceanispirochaeta sp.]|jgi:mannose-1-phosphate guanylyltransferase/mannose-6-phosphate isomerase|uniref:mannose-1-phosphate guanylyltransferase n=1 Tax=Oceanispirochaeta sp. TaxID=2035350 RepID=UPI00261FC136|nr:mannose-1-phosphate guanylyltransferase [Oceanispirochaeta sp.]MDA3958871.1 mannose-1-phosphate guanylyltransferase [Oceanispirochaeta sp.]
MVDHVIIMAGGAGKRLWPASNNSKPKQFMTVQGKDSLFLGTIKRAASLNIKGKILVVTHKDHVDAALEDSRHLPGDIRKKLILLAEPEARNTGPALAYAGAWLKEKTGNKEAQVLVLAADHLIQDVDQFARDVDDASILAALDNLVVFGIKPDFPSTGYGYIEAGEETGPGFKVVSFKEKPDQTRAEEFLKAGNYLWNSGMFTYKISLFEQELLAGSPDMLKPFLPALHCPASTAENDVTVVMPDDELTLLYASLPRESVDYALMEKSSRIAMVRSGFDWNDVGSWDVIADLNPPSEVPVFSGGNDSNFVYSDIPVALCGVEDLIVVIKNGKALICKKGESQLVKDAAEALST